MGRNWTIAFLLAAGLILNGCEKELVAVKPSQGTDGRIPYQAQIVAEELNVPWELVFLPDGRILFTERPGSIRVIENSKLLSQPLISFPAPFVSVGEGGLLGLAVDPRFAENHYLYAYHTYRDQNRTYNRVIRLREQGNRATFDKVILDRIPGSVIHNGGRIKISPDQKYLFITTGDARTPELAQNRNSLAGKILRINLDGTIPADNPFPNSPVYSWGHRNPQGLAWSPESGLLYSSEHGAQAHDEINVIEPGANYGWPVIQGNQQAQGMKTPLLQSGAETWAPSGMTFVSRGPLKNRLLVANLRGEGGLEISFVPGREPSVREVNYRFQSEYGRLRDVVEGPDGSLYILTSNRDGRGDIRPGDDKIIKLQPVR